MLLLIRIVPAGSPNRVLRHDHSPCCSRSPRTPYPGEFQAGRHFCDKATNRQSECRDGSFRRIVCCNLLRWTCTNPSYESTLKKKLSVSWTATTPANPPALRSPDAWKCSASSLPGSWQSPL